MYIRPLLVFYAFLLSAILCGALLAFPAYELLSAFSDISFRKTVSRTTLLSGLLFSLLYLAYSHTPSWRSLGMSRNRAGARLLRGLLAGLALMALIEINLLWLGVHQWAPGRDFSVSTVLQLALMGLVTGLLVGIIEELMFRGALYGGLSRQTGKATALIAVSLVYMAVHYLKFRDLPTDTAINWHTGVMMIPSALFQFAQPARYDAMLTLFLLGLLLGLVRIASNSIIPCIGIHTGVVLGENLIQHATRFIPQHPHAHLVNRYEPFVGDLASAWLLLCCLLCYFYCRLRPG